MAYTPIGWQTGDTITAEKMNKMDNGWGVQNTQLFSETVTTADNGGGMNVGVLVYSQTIDSDTIAVTFNNTNYTCPRVDAFGEHFYGGFTQSGPDFSEYPFAIESGSQGNALYTQTAGTYTIAVTAEALLASDDFSNIVNNCVDTSTMPMQCISGVTTQTAMETAQQGARLLYFKYDGASYIIVAAESGNIGFTPYNTSIVVSFIDGVFNVSEA